MTTAAAVTNHLGAVVHGMNICHGEPIGIDNKLFDETKLTMKDAYVKSIKIVNGVKTEVKEIIYDLKFFQDVNPVAYDFLIKVSENFGDYEVLSCHKKSSPASKKEVCKCVKFFNKQHELLVMIYSGRYTVAFQGRVFSNQDAALYRFKSAS